MTDSRFESTAIDSLPNMAAAGTPYRVGDVSAPGYYFAPETLQCEPHVVRFDGKEWTICGAGQSSLRMPLTDVVYGPLQFYPAEPSGDIWPAPGDEFVVFVEVRDEGGVVNGYVQNPPPKLAEMLRQYGGEDFCMAEEWFGQDFLPEQPGLYRMRLRMYVDPAYQIDDHEWSDDEPGLEVLTIERLTAEPVPLPVIPA